jgi:hypothetical protein
MIKSDIKIKLNQMIRNETKKNQKKIKKKITSNQC